MKTKFNRIKALFVAAACGGIPFVTEAACSQYGAYIFRDDDGDYYYNDDYYYDDYYYDDYYYEPYCDPYYCY